ncbi:HipA domain-containing protein [Alcaligenaceae bacterium A4P071]|nr:HipA domain-containing protein [Alcaligenaceae bacterium A4P071]
MTSFNIEQYRPGDALYLWWLGNPADPRLIGELHVVRTNQGVSLTYDDRWLATGFALSEDLPLQTGTYLPLLERTAAGAVDDARPDRWGEKVIRVLDKPVRLAVLDFLFYAGDERFGALGVSVSRDAYLARTLGALPSIRDVDEIEKLIQSLLRGEDIDERKKRLIEPGTTLGGARPKALLDMDGHQWVLKFNELGESIDWPLVEHATMTLCARAGIRAAETRPVKLNRGHAVAVRRFDRHDGLRTHALSANVALRAAGEELGYPQMAQLLRRRGVTQDRRGGRQMHELFRRMIFNILMDNTDDHEKNHAFLMTDEGHYDLSPAYDVLPAGQALGYQAMIVGDDVADSTLSNALSQHVLFGLKMSEARQQIQQVCDAVSTWKAHFATVGVTPGDIASLARQIDRPFLLQQRENV